MTNDIVYQLHSLPVGYPLNSALLAFGCFLARRKNNNDRSQGRGREFQKEYNCTGGRVGGVRDRWRLGG
ncbi:hypothetical protein [Pseudomonas sp. S3_A03]